MSYSLSITKMFADLPHDEMVGMYYLQLELEPNTTVDGLRQILKRVQQTLDHYAERSEKVFTPNFTFSLNESQTQILLTVTRPVTNETIGVIPLMLDELKKNLILAHGTWKALAKYSKTGISHVELKMHLDPVFENMGALHSNLLRSFMRSIHGNINTRKLYSFDLDIRDDGVKIVAYYLQQLLTTFDLKVNEAVVA